MKTKSELFIRDLGDGLILRRAFVEDADALADINSRMHSDDGPDKPDMGIAAWIQDLVAKPHPTLKPSDFTIVEEAASGKIVSTLCLIPQTWTFDGIEFGVGRPELVCTLPEFRRRGLVRIQMEEVHKWSEERGYLVQVITGIPNYYRQFGYEMALNLSGGRRGFEPNVPALKEGETEPFNIRAAGEGDVDFILQLYETYEKRYGISCKRTPEIIRYEMNDKNALNINRYEHMVIEDLNGVRVGFFEHSVNLWFGGVTCLYFALADGASWMAISPSVVRYLWKKGAEYAERDSLPSTSFGFNLGEQHPVYEVMEDKLPVLRKPYAYFMRVPDLSAFLNHVKPALEKRLSESVAVGYTGELKIGFYKDGLRMVFESGRISLIESTRPDSYADVDVAFPDLTFLHLLFGHRSFDELRHAFTDCFVQNQNARVLVNALFPKRPSAVQPIS
jgi:hypothetical protein